jgi:hypothetical protein
LGFESEGPSLTKKPAWGNLAGFFICLHPVADRQIAATSTESKGQANLRFALAPFYHGRMEEKMVESKGELWG